jgi:antitoxin ChpS
MEFRVMAHTAILRKVGGSVMIAIPPALLDVLNMTVGQQVAVSVDSGKLVIEAQQRPNSSLAELLAQCDLDAPVNDEDRSWLSSGAIGREEI